MVDRSTLMGSPRGSCQRLVILALLALQHRRIGAASNWPILLFATRAQLMKIYSRAELMKIGIVATAARAPRRPSTAVGAHTRSWLLNRTRQTAEAVPR